MKKLKLVFKIKQLTFLIETCVKAMFTLKIANCWSLDLSRPMLAVEKRRLAMVISRLPHLRPSCAGTKMNIVLTWRKTGVSWEQWSSGRPATTMPRPATSSGASSWSSMRVELSVGRSSWEEEEEIREGDDHKWPLVSVDDDEHLLMNCQNLFLLRQLIMSSLMHNTSSDHMLLNTQPLNH